MRVRLVRFTWLKVLQIDVRNRGGKTIILNNFGTEQSPQRKIFLLSKKERNQLKCSYKIF